MRYAYRQSESSTVSLVLAIVLIMNAEYKKHKQIWQVLKPREDFRLEAMEPMAWARPLVPAAVPKSLDWSLAIFDPPTAAHGISELTSPLSE
jgi:hypothetical protein